MASVKTVKPDISAVSLIRRWMALKPVTADVAAVNRVADDLAACLQAHGVNVAVEELAGRKILYASTRLEKMPDLLLNAHLDVVPAADPMFTLREEGGMLFGRGVHDCIGNAAVIARVLLRLNGAASVGAIFSTDEETGGQTTAEMVRLGYGARKMALVLDGEGGAVTLAQKGILNVRLIARGRACHAAEPWLGDNAVDRLLDGYAKIRDLFAPAHAGDEWHNTLAATILHAGTVRNRVPESAEMTLNIRFIEPGGDRAIMERLRALSGLEIHGETDCQPLEVAPGHPLIRRLAEAMSLRLGREIPFPRMNGATDARHFAALGVPVAILGVPGRHAHADTENLEAAMLPVYEDILAEFAAGL